MQYTLTVWIDYEADSAEEAQVLAADLRAQLTPALRHTAATKIESEWAGTDRALLPVMRERFAEAPSDA
jgi:hypothetical protein